MSTVKINTPLDITAESASRLFAWAVAVSDTIIAAPGDRKLRLGDLSPAGVHYVADYGVSQSMTDVHSGMAKKVADADDKTLAKFATEAGLVGSTDRGAIAAGVVNARQAKRFDAIVASSLAVRETSGRLSTRDAWIAKAALDEIRVKHDRAGKEMPKGQAIRDLTAKYVTAKADYFSKLWLEHNMRLEGAAQAADEILGF